MPLLAQERARIHGIAEVVPIVAFHVDNRVAEVSLANQCPHTPGGMTELSVVPDGQAQPACLGQPDELLGLMRVECKRLLHVHMTPMLEALSGDCEMALGRGRDVHRLWPGLVQELVQIIEVARGLEPLGKLPGHQLFAVAGCHEITSLDAPELLGMSIGDLAASDDGHPKRHCALVSCSSRSSAEALLLSSRPGSNPGAL